MLKTIRDLLKYKSKEKNYDLIDGKAALNTKEAEEITGISKQKLIKLAKNGEIPYFKNGTNYMFSTDQLFKWLKNRSRENYVGERDCKTKHNVKLLG